MSLHCYSVSVVTSRLQCVRLAGYSELVHGRGKRRHNPARGQRAMAAPARAVTPRCPARSRHDQPVARGHRTHRLRRERL